MPNPHRISYAGALYHIIGRGNDKRDIFIDDFDRQRYLGFLRGGMEDFDLEVYAYALMSNHVHILLKTNLPNISSAIYRVHLDYSKYFNARHGRCGHVFGTRFKSKLVQKDRYFLALLRYIHMNPVKAGLSGTPEAYSWSSHRAYLGEKDSVITDTNDALMLFGEDSASARAKYAAFICEDIPEKEWIILDMERNGVLGTSSFRASVNSKR